MVHAERSSRQQGGNQTFLTPFGLRTAPTPQMRPLSSTSATGPILLRCFRGTMAAINQLPGGAPNWRNFSGNTIAAC